MWRNRNTNRNTYTYASSTYTKRFIALLVRPQTGNNPSIYQQLSGDIKVNKFLQWKTIQQ